MNYSEHISELKLLFSVNSTSDLFDYALILALKPYLVRHFVFGVISLRQLLTLGVTDPYVNLLVYYGLFPLPDSNSDSDLDTDSCTMQDFPLVQIWTLIA